MSVTRSPRAVKLAGLACACAALSAACATFSALAPIEPPSRSSFDPVLAKGAAQAAL